MVQGSTVIGVSFKGSDVDAVMLVPNFIDRSDFFDSFVSKLKTSDKVKNLTPVPDTFVPLIRLWVLGIKVDLLISVLGTSYVPSRLDFTQPVGDLYNNMDEVSIRSLSGLHMAYEVKNLLSASPLFLALLRTVRVWVSARSLGSYVQGFPSSAAWTVLALYVCKQAMGDPLEGMKAPGNCICKYDDRGPEDSQTENHCNHSLTCLVHSFFGLFASWPWPKPVIIDPQRYSSEMSEMCWDSESNPHDLMPIITPVFPYINAAYTVRRVTRQIVLDELKRGRDIVRSVASGEKNWNELFQQYDLRYEYRHYIFITFKAVSQNELNVVGGLIDANIRVFLQELENVESITSTRAALVPVIANENDAADYQRVWVVGMAIEPGPRLPDGTRARKRVDVTACWDSFIHTLSQKDPSTNFKAKLTHEYRKRRG
ncbi:unnamed protein product [Calicophoron daubneyi]